MSLPLPNPADGIADLSQEQALAELLGIMARLEGRELPLAESLPLWQRADALAAQAAGSVPVPSAGSVRAARTRKPATAKTATAKTATAKTAATKPARTRPAAG